MFHSGGRRRGPTFNANWLVVGNDLAAYITIFPFLPSSGCWRSCLSLNVPLLGPCGKRVCFVGEVAGPGDARFVSWLALEKTCGLLGLILSSKCGVDFQHQPFLPPITFLYCSFLFLLASFRSSLFFHPCSFPSSPPFLLPSFLSSPSFFCFSDVHGLPPDLPSFPPSFLFPFDFFPWLYLIILPPLSV